MECRDRVAEIGASIGAVIVSTPGAPSLADLLNDPDIQRELHALESSAGDRRSSGMPLRLVGGMAAAAVATIMLVQPVRSRLADEAHRETNVTATAAPRALSPIDVASAVDTLRWSRISDADLYLVRIWNTKGEVVWSGETRDNALPLPTTLRADVQYLWDVKARTGWDRWIESDLVPFIVNTR